MIFQSLFVPCDWCVTVRNVLAFCCPSLYLCINVLPKPSTQHLLLYVGPTLFLIPLCQLTSGDAIYPTTTYYPLQQWCCKQAHMVAPPPTMVWILAPYSPTSSSHHPSFIYSTTIQHMAFVVWHNTPTL